MAEDVENADNNNFFVENRSESSENMTKISENSSKMANGNNNKRSSSSSSCSGLEDDENISGEECPAEKSPGNGENQATKRRCKRDTTDSGISPEEETSSLGKSSEEERGMAPPGGGRDKQKEGKGLALRADSGCPDDDEGKEKDTGGGPEPEEEPENYIEASKGGKQLPSEENAQKPENDPRSEEQGKMETSPDAGPVVAKQSKPKRKPKPHKTRPEPEENNDDENGDLAWAEFLSRAPPTKSSSKGSRKVPRAKKSDDSASKMPEKGGEKGSTKPRDDPQLATGGADEDTSGGNETDNEDMDSDGSEHPQLNSGNPEMRSRHDSVASSSTDEESTVEEIESRFRPPPHKWSVYKSQKKREYGLRARESPAMFRIKATGSLHMVQRLELMDKLENHDGCVNCLNFNSSGTRLASGSDDTNVTIWDWAVGEPVITFDTKHRANVFQAKFMPLSGDCHIVTCARDGQVRLAELSVRGVCKETRKLASHRGAAHKLSVEVDSPHVFLTCGEDAVVLQIDLRDPKPNKLLVTRGGDGEKVPLYSVHSNPRNPREFATSGRDEYCRIYDKRKMGESQDGPVPIKKYCPHHLIGNELKPNVTCVVYNYDGTELLASYNDEDIYSFDTRHSDGAEYIRRFTGHRNSATVKGVNWYGASSEFVVSGSDCGNVFLWEKESEKIVHWMQGDEGGVVNCLEPHPTMPVLATSGLDHDVKIWVPSCEAPQFDPQNLRKLTRDNQRQRRAENTGNTDLMDAQFFHFVMQHLRRVRERRGGRRQRQDNGEGENEDSTDENSDAKTSAR